MLEKCNIFGFMSGAPGELPPRVPQCSVLGPLSFLIYINDICHVAKKSHLILFADDTNIFVADHNLNNLICNINYELQLISEWFQVNKLSLNVFTHSLLRLTS